MNATTPDPVSGVWRQATGKEDKTKVAMLLSAMGPEGVRRYNQFQWATGEDKDKFDTVVNKFETELIGERRVVFNRHQFWEYQRSEHQQFDDYLAQLRYMATKCDFSEKDNMIRDKLCFLRVLCHWKKDCCVRKTSVLPEP